MGVVAKFYVASKTEHAGGQGSVVLNAVTRGAENASWAAATPNGKIEMYVINQAALDRLVVGDEYLVTFERQEKPVPEDGHAFVRDSRPYHERDTCCAKCGHVETINGEPTHTA